MLKTTICDLFGIEHPIIQGGWLLAGQIAGLIKEIKPARVIIEEIGAEAETIISNLKNFYERISHD